MIPEGIVDTLWFDVEERCREFGDEFDVWQDGLGQAMLGLRSDGLFAATVGGIEMSIPRQVAKTFIVGRTIVALCTLFPGMTVLWTAHRLRTTTNTFQKLKGFVTRPAVRPYIEPGRNAGTALRDANGEQEIPFRNGSRILFGAREQGFGRGFDEVDAIVFDEGQILTIRALEDMVASTNQSRFPHGALLFYMGTPPRPDDPGEMFTERRRRALALKGEAPDFGEPVAAGDALFVECSADSDVGMDDGPDLNDPTQIEKANPSYPHRTPPVAIERLRENLPDAGSWRREGLGVWDEESEAAPVGVELDSWTSIATIATDQVDPSWRLAAIGLDMDLTGRVWVSAALHSGEQGVHVELDEDDVLAAGVDAAVERIWRVCHRRLPVVMPNDSGAALLEAPLRAKGAKVYRLNVHEQAQASQGLVQALKDETLTHLDDPVLDQAVRESGRIVMEGGRWRLARAGELAGAPLLAAACARHGAIRWTPRLKQDPNRQPGRTSGGRSSGRRAAGRR